MLNIIYCLCNYLSLLINIGYIYTSKIDINSNEYWIKKLKNNIETCGCMSIKCIQWILPRYQSLYPDTKLSKEFSIFYEHCHVHSINHTENLVVNASEKWVKYMSQDDVKLENIIEYSKTRHNIFPIFRFS